MDSIVGGADDGNGGGGSRRLVVTQLGHIKELVRQLEAHLGASSPDLCKHLVSQISSTTERSISLLITTTSRKRSMGDASGAPPLAKATKKRKTMGKLRHEVRVSSAGDHPADDGHSWRKYGQKEILGAKHPRGYYRCTHRHSQGCAATKQVQRTDEDPAFFDVVYLGGHTCVQSQRSSAAADQAAADAQAPEYDADPNASSALRSLLHNLTVKTEDAPAEQQQPTPFGFSPTPATATTSGCLVPAERSSPFSAPCTPENWPGVSPATSDSNNHAVSFPPFEFELGAGDDAQFGFEEAISAAFDRADDGELLDDFDIDVSSFLV